MALVRRVFGLGRVGKGKCANAGRGAGGDWGFVVTRRLAESVWGRAPRADCQQMSRARDAPRQSHALGTAATRVGHGRRGGEDLAGGLYVVATPIGNLSDMSNRALEVLKGADEVFCEDTRRTIKLLSAFGVRGKQLSSYHEHNKKSTKHRVALESLRRNPMRVVALVCDAGTPSVSDPGSELVQEARRLGIRVHCIPGPCAFAAALSACGITAARKDGQGSHAAQLDVHFVGFLPEKPKLLKRKLVAMSSIPAVHVAYVAPHDLVRQLRAMKEAFLGTTEIVLARELTKLYEEFWSGSIEEAIHEFTVNREPKGEFTILVQNQGGGAADAGDAQGETSSPPRYSKVLESLMRAGMSSSEAAKALVEISQLPLKKKEVYNEALAIKKRGQV